MDHDISKCSRHHSTAQNTNHKKNKTSSSTISLQDDFRPRKHAGIFRPMYFPDQNRKQTRSSKVVDYNISVFWRRRRHSIGRKAISSSDAQDRSPRATFRKQRKECRERDRWMVATPHSHHGYYTEHQASHENAGDTKKKLVCAGCVVM